MRLRDFLEARQHGGTPRRTRGQRRTEGDEIERRSRALGASPQHAHPPATFYAAAASGDVRLLRACVVEDVYHACQDNGAGAPVHFAAARGRAEAAAACSPARWARAFQPKESQGRFELTPLHVAATLFRRRDAAAAARADLEAAEADLKAADATETDATFSSRRPSTPNIRRRAAARRRFESGAKGRASSHRGRSKETRGRVRGRGGGDPLVVASCSNTARIRTPSREYPAGRRRRKCGRRNRARTGHPRSRTGPQRSWTRDREISRGERRRRRSPRSRRRRRSPLPGARAARCCRGLVLPSLGTCEDPRHLRRFRRAARRSPYPVHR